MKLRLRFILFFIGNLIAFIFFTGIFVAVFLEYVTPFLFKSEQAAYFSDVTGIILPFIFGGILFGLYFVNPLVTMLSLIKELSEGDYSFANMNQILYKKNGKLKWRYALYRELITDIYELARQQGATEKEREKLEEAKTNWISGVSHDLKTPLSYITGYSALLLDDQKEWSISEQQQFLTTIHTKSELINELISDLNLTFKLEALSENYPINKKSFDLVDFARAFLVDLANDHQTEGYEFGFQTDSEKLLIEADQKLLFRAVQNIVGNALAHNPKGTVIEIDIKSNQANVDFTIKDNGGGMSGATLEQLFKRYQRPEETENNVSGGLGLSVVKNIIEAHGGTISVESEVGEGSSFTFHLPL